MEHINEETEKVDSQKIYEKNTNYQNSKKTRKSNNRSNLEDQDNNAIEEKDDVKMMEALDEYIKEQTKKIDSQKIHKEINKARDNKI